MESVGSSSTAPPEFNLSDTPHNHHFSDRLVRSISHRLRLLHRADTLFFILGATGNVYTVNISATPSCTCPDRATPCKHILFVLIRVLNVPLDDPCLWRRMLRPCQLDRILNQPTSAEAFAGASLRVRFQQMLTESRPGSSQAPPEVMAEGGGTTCPVCLEVMGREEKVVGCGTCKNVIHEECFLAWKRSCRRRSLTCVLCRARWRNRNGAGEPEKYMNLSAYVDEDDFMDLLCS